MKLAYYIKDDKLSADGRASALIEDIAASGFGLYRVFDAAGVEAGTDALLSLGGDGTFLSAARIAVPCSLPVLGVNFGRVGFLSDIEPERVTEALKEGLFTVQDRDLLQVKCSLEGDAGYWPFALNETSVSRVSASMLGIDVKVDGVALPTYWSDGLLVATGTGSTAYSLSVGGPICTPDAKVFIVSPVSPHNLNLRPLIVPHTSLISISLRSRHGSALLSLDNRTYPISADESLEVSLAAAKLRRMCLQKSNFFNALRSRLFWGEDVRNGSESR